MTNVKIAWTADKDNPQYAMRHDTANFLVKNVGDGVIVDVTVVYDIVTVITTYDAAGNGATGEIWQNKTSYIGTMFPGDERNLTMDAPLHAAMLSAKMTLMVQWKSGQDQHSATLFTTTLDPADMSGQGSVNPSNGIDVMTYGSANN